MGRQSRVFLALVTSISGLVLGGLYVCVYIYIYIYIYIRADPVQDT